MKENLSIEGNTSAHFPYLNANELCIQNLLNCYCREVGNAKNSTQIVDSNQISDSPFPLPLKPGPNQLLKIDLNHIGIEILAWIGTQPSAIGNLQYQGLAFQRTRGTPWVRIKGLEFAKILSQELSQFCTQANEPDFLSQIEDSIRVSELLEQNHTHTISNRSSFIASEQSLIFGHPFHPSPKSRVGFSLHEVKKFSPELKASFQLHYFAVLRDFIIQESLEGLSADQLIRQQHSYLNRYARLNSNWVIVPTHPWQARQLLKMPEIKAAIEKKKIRDLGISGPVYFPTSSLRTVYSPSAQYLYKLSLGVRITNCFRRNALSELQSSIEITRLMRVIRGKYQSRYPHFIALEEPAYLTVDFEKESPHTKKIFNEGFGLALRSSFESLIQKDVSLVLTGSLFGNQGLGRNLFSQLKSPQLSSIEWFDRYLTLLLPPLLDLFFKDGIMFEPHLQNTIVGIRAGMPVQILVRDFDNARVVEGSQSASHLLVSREAIAGSVIYSESRAWNRFVYCLFVNHLGEAIFQLSQIAAAQFHPSSSSNSSFKTLRSSDSIARCAHLNQSGKSSETAFDPTEKDFWNVLKLHLSGYASASSDLNARQRVQALMSQSFLPAKGNMMTRFQRTPDSHAEYVSVPNPLSA